MKRKLSTSSVLFLSAPLFFFVSTLLTNAYLLGDQVHYRSLYSILGEADISQILNLQKVTVGSSEPLYGLLMWIGATLGVNKDIYVSIFNTILLLLTLRFLLRNSAGTLFSILLLTNYYTVVLLTSAERLKFAYICLALSANCSTQKGSFSLLLTSLLFHLQSAIVIAAKITGSFGRAVNWRLFAAGALAFAIFAPISVYVFGDVILNKLRAYTETSRGLPSITNILLLSGLSLCLPRRSEVLLIMATCAIAAFFLGGERVNMIAITFFVYIAVRDRKTSSPFVILPMLYFSFKSIGYLLKVFQNGTGF